MIYLIINKYNYLRKISIVSEITTPLVIPHTNLLRSTKMKS